MKPCRKSGAEPPKFVDKPTYEQLESQLAQSDEMIVKQQLQLKELAQYYEEREGIGFADDFHALEEHDKVKNDKIAMLRKALQSVLDAFRKSTLRPPELVSDMENQLARIRAAAIQANIALKESLDLERFDAFAETAIRHAQFNRSSHEQNE